ncbi:unnamed protein product [Rhizoctonia solani]|uniref:RGS domain-containing protein n=1 Tax=Rhizoctonia solani TaxID=456999 RepID=A0A8H3CZV9_9AGAM|nr:unnamed protein product [Rhizoctonia solani]
MTRPPVTLKLQSIPSEDIKIDQGNMSASTVKASPSTYLPHSRTTSSSKPSQDHSIPPRPRPFILSPSTLLDIPGRLARPPSVKSVGKQWSIVPEMAVSLDEILAMRHLSPLSLKDFEQYLLFEEYGAENLYFILWLNDYATQYHTGSSSLHLCRSVARAKATFFSSESQYELNLAAVRISEFYAAVDCTAPGESPVPPHPDAFAAIRGDVEVMLRTSARRFVKDRSRNAGTQRALCVVFGGLFTMAIALAPLMISRFSDHNRYIRFGMIPPLWLGFTVFLCSVNGVCLILYLMGGSRQLHPFELVRPTISEPIRREPQSSYRASLTTLDTTHDSKIPPTYSSAASFVQYPSAAHTPHRARSHDAVDLSSRPDIYVLPRIRPTTPIMDPEFEFETSGFIPSQEDDAMTVSDQASTYIESIAAPSTTVQSAGARSSATKFTFDFDTLPAKTLNATSGPPTLEAAHGKGMKGLLTKVFGPVTRIRSPVISRAQWEVVIRSMAVAAMVALIISSVFVAVPI